MQYRKLGGCGLKVSEISLGSWLTYGGYVEKQEAIKTISGPLSMRASTFSIRPTSICAAKPKRSLG